MRIAIIWLSLTLLAAVSAIASEHRTARGFFAEAPRRNAVSIRIDALHSQIRPGQRVQLRVNVLNALPQPVSVAVFAPWWAVELKVTREGGAEVAHGLHSARGYHDLAMQRLEAHQSFALTWLRQEFSDLTEWGYHEPLERGRYTITALPLFCCGGETLEGPFHIDPDTPSNSISILVEK